MSAAQTVGRRRFLAKSATSALGVAALRAVRVEAAPEFDLVIRGGTILDGTGGPAWPGDLGITEDTIAAVGEIPSEKARRTIDASGLHVCPGFVDIHSHSDFSLPVYPTADSRVRQGITTEVTGNCGSSAAPLGPRTEDRIALLEEGVHADWSDVAGYCASLEKLRVSANQALLLGQGTLREIAVGMVDRPLSADEMRGVLRAVEQGMDQGAFGMSTGLEYTPGRYTPTDEIVAMARIVARYGGLYATHTRNEESTLLEAVNEAIEIGRRSGARVEISHLKAAGRPYWSKQGAALGLIESARRDGVEVFADAYPYTAYSTGLTVLFENWALEGGTPALMARLKDPAGRARLRKEIEARVPREPGGYDLIVISSVRGDRNRATVGRNLLEIAALWNVDPADALLRLVEEEEASVGYVGHGMSPENVELVLAHPLVMIGSDGNSMAPTGRAAQTRPHPRSYGTCPRVLGHYCRERRLFELPAAVRKMTSMPADQAGLRERGRIARGQKADLVLFDAASVADEASFDDPHRYPRGIPHVLVSGVSVVESGAHTGARPGRMLRRS